MAALVLATTSTAASAPPALAFRGPATCMGVAEEGGDARACRDAELLADLASGRNVEDFRQKSAERPAKKGVVPVAELGDSYVAETKALADEVRLYGSLDPYDASRVALIKGPGGSKDKGPLVRDLDTWVSRYAPGGSARKQSARTMYVVVDALEAHLARNGLAPFPPASFAKLLGNLEEVDSFLAQGR